MGLAGGWGGGGLRAVNEHEVGTAGCDPISAAPYFHRVVGGELDI